MSEKKEKNVSILQAVTIYACFAGEWNTKMTSQSKLDPFSCIVVQGPEKRPTSLLWKGTTSEGKIQGQKLFALVNRAVAKLYLSEKKLEWGGGGSGTLSELEKQLFSRDILLTFAKRPEKPLVKTREIRTLVKFCTL